MSLDFSLLGPEYPVPCRCSACNHAHTRVERDTYFATNITHNLGRLFRAVDLYDILWHGDGLIAGSSVLPKLEAGLAALRADPALYRAFDAPNGWGTYDDAVPWLAEVVDACRTHPDARLSCSR